MLMVSLISYHVNPVAAAPGRNLNLSGVTEPAGATHE
jgi:hypothetical protein